MPNFHNKQLVPFSRKLRKDMTKEERHLWYDFLKPLTVTFHRQKIIGEYIVDFYCASAKLVIELDGSQHFDPAGIKKDAKRNTDLRNMGLTVLRYTNLDIQQHFNAVCQDIWNHLS